MVVLVSYYSDGSGAPEIQFIPSGNYELARAVDHMRQQAGNASMTVRAFEIQSIERMPLEIMPGGMTREAKVHEVVKRDVSLEVK